MVTYYVDSDAAGGGDGSSGTPYDSLSAAEAARNTADGQGGGSGSYTDIVRYLCSASSGGADTTDCYVNGGSQTSSYYLLIQAADGHRATAKYNSSKYRIELTSVASTSAIAANDDYVRVDGIQVYIVSVTDNYCGGIRLDWGISASNQFVFTNCLVHGPVSDDTYGFTCFGSGDPDTYVYIINCVGRQVASANSGRICISLDGVEGYVYNCTAIGGQMAIRSAGSCVTYVKNCYGGGSTYDCFYRRDTAYLYKTNCASADGTADDTSAYETASNCIVSVAVDTSNFLDPTNATVLDRDFHLAGTGSGLYGAGVAPGGSDPLNYTTDIDGDTIGGGSRYDIGADWYYSAPAGATVFKTMLRRWR